MTGEMLQQPMDLASEVKRLQRCMNDLVSILALPAVWSGSEPLRILETVLDALLGMLNLDFLYARVRINGEAPTEVFRNAEASQVSRGWEEIRQALYLSFEDDAHRSPEEVLGRLGELALSVFPVRMGVEGDLGLIVAGSQRPGFPAQTERLVLNVAANQAAIGLQQALLLNEQRRIASELDRRVAERTAELATANEVLRTEMAERTWAEEELKRSEARHRLVVETASDAVVSIDEHGMITLANPATKSVFGHEPAELIGRPLTVLMPESTRTLHEDGYKHYLETGARRLNWRGTELTARRANGVDFPVEVSFGEMTAHESKIFTGFIRDISEKKRAEEALRASARNLSLIINTMPVLAWSALPDGALEFFNQRWLDYTGLTPAEAQGWGWTEAIHPDDIDRMTGYWRTIVASGGPGEIEARLRRFNGEYRWFLFRADAMHDESGAIVKWYGTNTDMHGWKQAQEDLRNMQAELARMTRVMTIGQLTASIAHEVSQPLSGIIVNASTCLRMLSSDPPNLEGARETVRRTIRDGNRATDVLTRLRTLFSKKQINAEPVDLNEATTEVIALLLGELQKNSMILHQHFSDDLPRVMGDRIQLQQVILNLVRNASDAMVTVNDRPRRLLVRTATDNDEVQVSVEDSGVGFDPKAADRLFESFFTTKQEGMGVGLSLSRSIVEAHHGRLWATSNEGQGATFAFSIPCHHGRQVRPKSS
jgi:PAS domain S-box-containing protein